MLPAEAEWLADRLAAIEPDRISPLLNVGSSTAHFRAVRQPWIERRIFAPLRARAIDVTHLDLKHAAGVDLAGDLMDPDFVRELSRRGFRSVLCSNVLEHVTDRDRLCTGLRGLVAPGGYLIVTVPRRFPYHPDPIDTGFRPSVADLVALFPDLEVEVAAEVDCGSFWDSLTRGPVELALRLGWVFAPFLRPKGWWGNLHRLASIGTRYSATCAVFRRAPERPA